MEAGARGSFAALGVWLRHLKILANLLGQVVVDFVMAWDAGGFLRGAVHLDRVVTAFPE